MRFSKQQTDELRELVMTCWDPVGLHVPGVTDGDRARYWDEYDSYLPIIVVRAQGEDGEDNLREYLEKLRTEDMGLTASPDRDRAAAARIARWLARAARGA
jgi:hypothetical protein